MACKIRLHRVSSNEYLANEGYLSSFTKIDMSTCKNYFARKITHKSFEKAKRVEFSL